jgi:hypothetical protein
VGLPQRVYSASVVGVHGVQRLDREAHPGLRGCGQHRGNAVRNLLAGFRKGLVGNGSADQHNERRTDGMGLLDGEQVVVHRPLARCGVPRREKSASAEGDKL